MTVAMIAGVWVVLDARGAELSRHATNAEAWRWIDRQHGPVSAAEARHDWGFWKWANGE
jgi:hypothetical protein